jgi:hypothetical protein
MIVRQEFMAGDIVRYIPMGDKEYVLEDNMGITYPLFIKDINTFTIDGRISTNHTHPLLILIRRPEQKRKWYQVFYKMLNSEIPLASICLYENEEHFYTDGISKDKLEWIELKFVCER